MSRGESKRVYCSVIEKRISTSEFLLLCFDFFMQTWESTHAKRDTIKSYPPTTNENDWINKCLHLTHILAQIRKQTKDMLLVCMYLVCNYYRILHSWYSRHSKKDINLNIFLVCTFFSDWIKSKNTK